MMGFLKYSCVVFLVLLSTALIALFFLINTSAGLRFVASLTPDSVLIDGLDGDVSDLSVERLSVEFEGGSFSANDVKLRWSPISLLKRSLSVDTITLHDATLILSNTDDAPSQPYRPWVGLDLPVDLDVDDITLNGLLISQNSQEVLHLDTAKLAFEINNNVATITTLELQEQANMAVVKGQVDLANVNDGLVELTTSIDWAIGPERLMLDGNFSGDWHQLIVSQRVNSPVKVATQISLQNVHSERITVLADVQASERLRRPELLQNLVIDSAKLDVSGTFLVNDGLAGLDIELAGNIALGYAQQMNWLAEFGVAFDGRQLLLKSFELAEQGEARDGQLRVTGTVDNLLKSTSTGYSAVQATIHGDWQKFGIVLDANAPMIKSGGTFEFVGSPSQASFKANMLGSVSDQHLNEIDFHSDIGLNWADETLSLDNVYLRSGQTDLHIEGSVGANYSVDWRISSPNLSELIPQVLGDFNSDGRVTGSRDAPHIEFNADSSEMRWSNSRVVGFAASGNIAVFDHDAPLSVSVKVDELNFQGRDFARAGALDISGTTGRHKGVLQATLVSDTVMRLALRGGAVSRQDATGWAGDIVELSVASSDWGEWSLAKKASLKMLDQEYVISPTCIQNTSQSICLNADINPNSRAVNLALDAISLAAVNPLLNSSGITVTGQLDGQIAYSKQSEDVNSTLDGFLTSSNTVLNWQEAVAGQHKTKSVAVQKVDVNVAQTNQLSLNGLISMADGSGLEVSAIASRAFDSRDFESASLRGLAKLRLSDLSALPPELFGMLPVNGELDARIDLAGVISEPVLALDAAILNASVELPEVGLSLTEIGATVKSVDQSLVVLQGTVKSGDGLLDLDGQVDLADMTAPIVTAHLQGKALTLANTHELMIVGDLDLDTIVTKELVDLRGSVRLANAELDFALPESAVLASGDVILLGEEQVDKPIGQLVDLMIDLGESTHISAQGLDAMLVGELRVHQQPQSILRGDGQIDIIDGRYIAYGQDLQIDKGRFIFNGGSIDDPGLELRAQKTIDDTIAGVQVTGRVDSPVLSLYSTPAMSDQDVLSTLIFKKPISELGSQDGLVLLQIANSLRGDGKSGVAKVTERIQNTLGLTDLQLNLGSSAPSIQAGKQLSSKFYVGYGYSLLNAVQSLVLRYQLSDFWSIKADVGADSGADLRYQIER